MNISVFGIGYVGLSNAIVLAQHNDVLAVDVVKEKVELVNNKKTPIKDSDITEFLQNKSLRLQATIDSIYAIKNSDYIIIATPTNYDSVTNKFDTSSVESIIGQVKNVNPNAWIVIKSTVGIGFTKYVREKYNYDKILFSPEFLREGKALYDNLYPSRIIVGVPSKTKEYLEKANELAQLLKAGAAKNNVDILITESTEAEAVKLFSNTYLALRIAYFNELDTFASVNELNTLDIIKGVCADPRIGDYYNNPSFGYGGYCLPKDTKELKANYDGVPENLISAIIESNKTRKQFIANEIINLIKHKYENINNAVIGIYRLTMKTDSDNFRQSAIIDIMEILIKKGINLLLYEPSIKESNYHNCKVISNLNTFVSMCDFIIANRVDSDIKNVTNVIYTKDLFYRD